MIKEYTIQEVADRFATSTRTIQRYLKALYTKESNKIMIPLDVVELLEARHNYDTTTASEINLIQEGFTPDEYQEFKKRLIEYPMLKEQLEYHKRSAESHQRQMEMILANLNQRNIIEAKDKNILDGI